MLNSDGSKRSTCQSLRSKIRCCAEAVIGGVTRVARLFNKEFCNSEIARRTGHPEARLENTFHFKLRLNEDVR
jgi:hypothetical protein